MNDPGIIDAGDIIRGLARRLELPMPARARFMRELRQDLDGLTTRFIESGVPPAKARRRAAETLVPDDATLRELARMGMPRYRRITGTLVPTRLREVERATFVLATLAILGLEAWTLLGAGLLHDPSPFLWPLLGSGAVLLTAVVAKAFELWVKGVYEGPRRGLGAIAGLCLWTLGLGFAGALVDFTLLATTLEADPSDAVARTTTWLVQDAALLSTAIILAIPGALGWLGLSAWVTHMEHEHDRALDPERPAAPRSTERPRPVSHPNEENRP